MDMNDVYNVGAVSPVGQAAPSAPYPRPQSSGQGVSGSVGFTGALGTNGMEGVVGALVLAAVAFWLLHT